MFTVQAHKPAQKSVSLPGWLLPIYIAIVTPLGVFCALAALRSFVLFNVHNPFASSNSILLLKEMLLYTNEFGLAAAIATIIVSLLLWRYCITRIASIQTRQAIIAGALFSFIAHWITWYLTMLLAFFLHIIDPFGSSHAILTLNPFSALLASTFYSFISIIAAGWFTALMGGFIAWALLRLFRAFYPSLSPQ